ncbi:hypothetical protein DV738_g421, partial [Chaetothyriales sp. CBS 135597]
MAYTHPPHHDARGPPPPDPMRRDEPRPGWGPPPYHHPSAYNQRPPSSLSSPDLMDPEDSGSDVSVGGNDPYHHMGGLSEPTPPGPLKQSLESVEAIHARLGELNHIEDANIHRQNALTEKRRRLDERIRMKREAQDRKIQAIYAARERRDARIKRRRDIEDARFHTIDDQIEEEQNSLHRRLKRLKRPTSAPSYSFYPPSQQPYSVPYHPPTGYSTVPPPQPHPPHQMQPQTLPSQGGQPPPQPPPAPPPPSSNDRSPYIVNGKPQSPMNPPASSGFASINAPPHSGFAAVNARPGATPPAGYSTIVPPPPVVEPRPPNAAFPEAQSESQRYAANGKANDSAHSTPASAAAGKRAPSTTHPYQMSEAFANRHHHCERVDGLNRGIWTYHGPNLGTAEHPTGPPVEMYLRCNHDGCRRIDWRTVHGLQCHIVKNHEQPKGTIGSLEKALDRYGVAVAEVEEYERAHGEGTGGTMADPKNLKIKNKLREGGRKSAPTPSPGSWGLEPTTRPAGYKPVPGAENAGKLVVEKGMGDFVSRRAGGLVEDVNTYEPESSVTPQYERPPSGHKPRVDSGQNQGQWNNNNNSTPSRLPPHSIDVNRQLQGDAVMADQESAPRQPAPPPNSAPEARSWHTANATIRPYGPSAPSPVPKHVAILQNSPPDSSERPQQQTQSAKPENRSAAPSESPQISSRGKEDEKRERVDASPAANTVPNGHSTDKDVDMTEAPVESHADQTAEDAMELDSKKEANSATTKQATGQEGVESESKASPAPVDGPFKSTRASMNSPTVNHKPLAAPTGAKRSRRSSASRRLSQDVSTDGPPTAPPSNADEAEKGFNSSKAAYDGEETITAVSKKPSKEEELKDKEVPKTPPRRNAGRFSRRKNAG